jgi:hypothetical protein
LAGLCGADDIEAMALFGPQKAALLRRSLARPHGPPPPRPAVASFSACFLAGVQQGLPPDPCAPLCLDGKPPAPASRLGCGRATGRRLGQGAGRGKGHELAALPERLALLALRGALLRLDALRCQPTIAQPIVGLGGHYLLGRQGKQPTLLAPVSPPLRVQQAYVRGAFAGDGPRVTYQV